MNVFGERKRHETHVNRNKGMEKNNFVSVNRICVSNMFLMMKNVRQYNVVNIRTYKAKAFNFTFEISFNFQSHFNTYIYLCNHLTVTISILWVTNWNEIMMYMYIYR